MKLCDTSVLVDIDRGGVDDRVDRLDDEGRHAISTVSVTELRLGVNKKYSEADERRQEALDGLDRLLARFEIIDADRAVATAAADVIASLQERGEPLNDLHDVYIAATARTEQLSVLTANVDDFDRIDDVTVVDWAEF